MRKLCAILSAQIIIIFAFSSLAGEVIPGNDIEGGVFGEIYECAFPNTVEVDGILNDQAWLFAPWHKVEEDDGTSPAPDAIDASYLFAVVADNEWLYVAFKVTDDEIVIHEVMGTSLYADDSVEIYIDANHARTQTYEMDDSQITIGAVNIDLGDIGNPELGGTGDGPLTGTEAAVVESADGWIVEAAVPLKNDKWDIVPTDGMVIGFNTHFNDDDDGGDRDHKLIWSLDDIDDHSYDNTSRFADLVFKNVYLAVGPGGKLSCMWGQIKRY